MIERLRKHQHLALLAVLLLVLIAQPLVAHESRAARVAFELLFGLALVATLFTVFERRKRRLAALLMIVLLALTVTEQVAAARWFTLASVGYHVSLALFVGYAVGVLVRDIFRHRSIGFDDILGAFAGYILLGVAWGNLYAMVELLAPGAFSVSPEIRWQLEDWHLRRALFNYLSFTTMASLGYNDITPAAPIANTLTWIEVMTAQFYLAVVIAQIVGLKLAQAIAPGGRDGPGVG